MGLKMPHSNLSWRTERSWSCLFFFLVCQYKDCFKNCALLYQGDIVSAESRGMKLMTLLDGRPFKFHRSKDCIFQIYPCNIPMGNSESVTTRDRSMFSWKTWSLIGITSLFLLDTVSWLQKRQCVLNWKFILFSLQILGGAHVVGEAFFLNCCCVFLLCNTIFLGYVDMSLSCWLSISFLLTQPLFQTGSCCLCDVCESHSKI